MHTLAEQVAQLAMKARLAERLVHSRGTWILNIAGLDLATVRIRCAAGIMLRAEAPPECAGEHNLCVIEERSDRRELAWVQPVTVPVGGGAVEWHLQLHSPEQISAA